MNILYIFLVFFFFIYEYRTVEYGVRFQAPIGTKDGWAFLGHLNENERVVKLTPELRAIPVENISHSMEICGVYIHPEISPLFPFVIKIINKKRGNALITLKDTVNFPDLIDRYTFQIEEYDCDQPPNFSEKKFVLIEIGSINGPKFPQSSYHFTVNYSLPEGTKIGEISAYERPGIGRTSHIYQGICNYDILPANSVPFFIDEYGSLHTQKIEFLPKVLRTYRFYVRATDCDKFQPRISSVPVTVDVRDSCTVHWEGLPKKFMYFRNSGVMPLLSLQSASPSFHICSNDCLNFNITLTARIFGSKLNFASPELCKHDLQSINDREILCDASSDAINLLKNAKSSMQDEKIGGYRFSLSHIPVESNLDNMKYIFGKTFSLSFWMKHENMPLNDPKQQILCNSDLKVMNRHHASVFLHNCKLILLIRVENGESDINEYRPSEWRFGPLMQVCDNKWHHYAITMNDGNPILQIDGEIWQKSPEILVEKPLKMLPGNINGTRLTVGSCYHSKSNEYLQNFIGHLAGMRLIPRYVEAINTIRCMATCGESLLLPHIVEVLERDSSVTMFSEYIIFRTNNINDLKLMLSKLSYVNTNPLTEKHNNEESQRTITVDTELKCQSGEIVKTSRNNIKLEILESLSKTEVNAHSPLIEIDSTSKVNGQLNKPINLFPNINFQKINGDGVKIKSCIVRPLSYLIQSWESINWPVTIPISYHISSLNNSRGLVFEGVQSIEVYQMLMRQITYITTKSDPKIEDRKFGLMCAMKEKRFTKELVVKVQIIDDLRTYYIVDDQTNEKSYNNDSSQVLHAGNDRSGFKDRLVIDKKTNPSSNKHPFIVPIIVVISVIFVIILGLVIYGGRKKLVKSNASRKSGSSLNFNKKSESCHLSHNSTVDEDASSIISDCPQSEDDQDMDETEQLRSNDDCNSSECNNARIEIPKYMNLSNKTWISQFNDPVDV